MQLPPVYDGAPALADNDLKQAFALLLGDVVGFVYTLGYWEWSSAQAWTRNLSRWFAYLRTPFHEARWAASHPSQIPVIDPCSLMPPGFWLGQLTTDIGLLLT